MERKSVKDTERDTLKGETKSAKGTSKKAFKEQDDEKALNLKSLTKSSVWDIQENDVFRALEAAAKDAELKENLRHFTDIIRSAFMMEEVKDNNKTQADNYSRVTKSLQLTSVRMPRSHGLSRNVQSCALPT